MQKNSELLRDLDTSFRDVFLAICREGFSVLGRTLLDLPEKTNPWQYNSGYPPSYSAQGRYRFLKTLEIARKFNPQRVLEVAAGGGFNGACLYEPGREIVLNDLKPLQQEVMNWSTGQHLEVTVGNLFDLNPTSLGQFDLVIACEVLEHIAHGDEFIAHLRKFLSPKGVLLLTTPNGAYFRSKLPTYSQITDFVSLEFEQFKPDADGHLYLYTPEEIVVLLKSLAFKEISVNLSITPWLSGHMGLRFLPRNEVLTPLYYSLDELTKRLGSPVRTKLCFQTIVCASLG